MARRYKTNEQRNRNLEPYYRKFQKLMYGGREWMNILLAIGTIDDLVIAKMNEQVQALLARHMTINDTTFPRGGARVL